MLWHCPSKAFQPNWAWHYEWENPEDRQEELYISETLMKAGQKCSRIKADEDGTIQDFLKFHKRPFSRRSKQGNICLIAALFEVILEKSFS
jgi:hypothetical protein